MRLCAVGSTLVEVRKERRWRVECRPSSRFCSSAGCFCRNLTAEEAEVGGMSMIHASRVASGTVTGSTPAVMRCIAGPVAGRLGPGALRTSMPFSTLFDLSTLEGSCSSSSSLRPMRPISIAAWSGS